MTRFTRALMWSATAAIMVRSTFKRAQTTSGDIFVGDGHTGGGTALGNARVMKFDKSGKFLKTCGKKGMGPGEFDVVHALALDFRERAEVRQEIRALGV